MEEDVHQSVGMCEELLPDTYPPFASRAEFVSLGDLERRKDGAPTAWWKPK